MKFFLKAVSHILDIVVIGLAVGFVGTFWGKEDWSSVTKTFWVLAGLITLRLVLMRLQEKYGNSVAPVPDEKNDGWIKRTLRRMSRLAETPVYALLSVLSAIFPLALVLTAPSTEFPPEERSTIFFISFFTAYGFFSLAEIPRLREKQRTRRIFDRLRALERSDQDRVLSVQELRTLLERPDVTTWGQITRLFGFSETEK